MRVSISTVLAIATGLIVTGVCGTSESALAQGEGQKPAKRVKVKRYPLEFCLVSDDKLGEMGKPVAFAYQRREIKLCCKDCRDDFDKEPARYLKKLEDLERKQGQP